MSAGRSGAAGRRSRSAPRTPEPPASPAPVSRPARFWVAAAVAIAAWLVIWTPQLFSGQALVRGDWPDDAAYSELSASRWHDTHQRTLWNPYVFLGLPSAASLADSRPQYLPDLLLDAVSALDRFPVWPPLILPLLAHLAGMLAIAWLVRAVWNAGTIPMTWAAIAWGLMPFQLVPLAFGHRAQLVTVGLMPVSLLAVHALFAAWEWRRAAQVAVGLALVIALQLLAGHPQFTYLSLLLSAAFAFERAVHFRRMPRVPLAAGAVLLALAMSAAVWLPMIRYGADSVRGLPGGVLPEEIRLYSLAFRDFAGFAWTGAVGRAQGTYWGGLNGTDFPQYFGVVVLLLAALAARRGAQRGVAVLLAAAAVAGVALSLGVHLGPLYRSIHAAVPFWSRFRVAVAPLIVAQLACVLLAARGLQSLLERPPRRAPLLLGALAAVIAAIAVFALAEPFLGAYARAAMNARPGFPESNAHGAAAVALPTLLLMLVTLALALVALGFARGRARGVAGAALIALTALDLGLVSVPLLREATAPRERLAPGPRSELARLTASEPGTRAATLDPAALALGGSWIGWRVPWVGGSHGTPPRLWSASAGRGSLFEPPVLRALAVRYLSAPADAPPAGSGFERVAVRDGERELWRLRETRPRAYAVTRVGTEASDDRALAAMATRDSFPDRVAFTTEAAAAGEYPGSAGASIRWTEDQPDRIALDVESPGRAFVVVADAYFAGWSARVDRSPSVIHRVNHLLRGVVVPEGRHTLAMEYVPPGWKAGTLTTRLAWIVWLILLGTALVLRPKRVS